MSALALLSMPEVRGGTGVLPAASGPFADLVLLGVGAAVCLLLLVLGVMHLVSALRAPRRGPRR